MTAEHKPYPAYKPSGIEWLRDVPAHWEVQRLRYASEMRVSNVDKHTKEYESPIRLCNYVDVYNNEYITERIEFLSATATLAEIDRFRLEAGDVLITKDSEKWDDIGVPALVQQAADDLICGYHLALLRSLKSKLDGGYLLRALQSPVVSCQSHVEAKGVTRYGLTHASIKSVQLPIPPLAEQRAIAAFLHRETAKIDALVSKKERLIELLQEKRTALISHTVTKGLNPGAPMKGSGIEWLGEIPAHWEVQRLRYLADIKTGDRDTVDRQIDGEYPFFVRSQTVERIDSWSVEGEAVLTAGDGVGVGKVFHYVNGKFDYHQRVYMFSNFRSVVGKFFFHYFRAMLRYEVFQGTAKSTVDSLRLPMLQNFPVVVPPISEQRSIIVLLENETSKLDSLMAKVNEAVELLKELRATLISAAVTGKIDVREEIECT